MKLPRFNWRRDRPCLMGPVLTGCRFALVALIGGRKIPKEDHSFYGQARLADLNTFWAHLMQTWFSCHATRTHQWTSYSARRCQLQYSCAHFYTELLRMHCSKFHLNRIDSPSCFLHLYLVITLTSFQILKLPRVDIVQVEKLCKLALNGKTKVKEAPKKLSCYPAVEPDAAHSIKTVTSLRKSHDCIQLVGLCLWELWHSVTILWRW